MPPCNTATSVTVSSSAVALKDDSMNETKSLPKKRISNKHNADDDPVLKWMYIVLCYLCISMVGWILVAPASWLIPRSTWHRDVLLPLLERMGGFRVVPVVIITKFQEHTLVHFTHILPAAIWAGIIPFQLHPTWRHQHRQLHRILGYVFVATALSIATGIGIIVQRKLTYDHSFPDLPPQNPLTHAGSPPALAGLAFWFAGTALYAAHLARTKQYAQHKVWIVRHVATGIFVAIQRFICIPLGVAIVSLTHPPPDPVPSWLQRDVFGGAGTAAALTSILLGEYAIHRIKSKTSRLQLAPQAHLDRKKQ